MNGNGKGKSDNGIEIFGHIRRAHEDAAQPSLHPRATATMGWMANLSDLEAGEAGEKDENVISDEMLQSLSIIKERERDLVAVEMTIGRAVNDLVSASLIENRLRLSPSVKGQGRKDLKEIMGGVKQNISMPTALQKTRRILTGRGGKVEEAETTDTVEVGE